MKIRTTTLLSAAALLAAASTYGQTLTNYPKWESTATVGLTITRGNSDSTTIAGSASTIKKSDVDKISLGIDGMYGTAKAFGQTSTTRNAEMLHGFGQYDRNFTDRFYGYGRLEGLHDDVAYIGYRLTASPGAGYYLIKDKAVDLSAEMGPGCVIERIGHESEKFATLRIGEKFHWAISDRARVWQTAEILPQVSYIKNYIVNAELGIEADLDQKKKWALRFTLDDTYNNIPAPAHVPNDLKLIASLAYKF